MDDFISREAAMRAIIDKQRDHTTPWRLSYELGKKHAADEYVDAIKAIPAADVRPVVRGEWIKYAPHNSDMMTCSECEKYWILDGDQYEFNFCPNCGADMREPNLDATKGGNHD